MIELMQTIEVNSVDPHDTKHLDSSNFQKTEIGQIPKDWELVDLGAVSIISRLAGAEYTSVWRESPSGEIIALRGFNIEKNKINLRDIVRISDKLSRKLKRSRLTKGDVVYPCVGTIGNAAVIYEDDTYHIQQNIARITPDTSRVKSEFLSHYLTSSFAEKEVEKFNATSSQPNVLVSSLRQYKVPLPKTLNEQTAIANALSDVDALIQELEKLIAKKQAIKTATMQQLLTGRTRLPPFGFEKSAHHPDGRKKGYKPSELGEIPEDWEVVSIETALANKQILEQMDGNHGELYPKSHEFSAFGVPYIGATDFSTGKIDYKGCKFLPEYRAKKFKKGISIDGDVLFAHNATVGPVTLVETTLDFIILSTTATYYRCNPEKISNRYLCQYFSSTFFVRQYSSVMSQSTRNQVPILAQRKFYLVLPCLDEQSQIASVLTDIEDDIRALDQRLNKTRQIKQGMMQELLTGKTRLVKPAGAA